MVESSSNRLALQCSHSRRSWMLQSARSIGAVALASLIEQKTPALLAAETQHVRPRAKRVIQLFMAGAASHLDLWDYKPELIKLHGRPSDFGEPVEAFQNGLGPWLKPVWKFRPYGQSQKWLSEVVAPLGAHVDDIAFVHNVVGKSGIHSQGTLLQTTGFQLPGFPSAGSWVSYALGSMNDNLPTFVVLPDHRGYASNGVKNWDTAFLPTQFMGNVVDIARASPIADLNPDTRLATYVNSDNERETQRMLKLLNREHAAMRSDDPRLESRIRSYELAAGMQLAAPEAFRWRDEPDHVLKLYGVDREPSKWPAEINEQEEIYHFGTKCLTARRLLERGVRFVQIWSGNDNGFPRRNWDSHEDIERDHGPLAVGMACGAAALITDLKQRGLLEDTIVQWTTEFGRMPSTQGGRGRDHNPYVFTNWFCGGGFRGGVTYGESDAWGYKPLDRAHPTEVHDVHATMLHLLGIDHKQLTVRHGGADRRLTDVHGHVMHEII